MLYPTKNIHLESKIATLEEDVSKAIEKALNVRKSKMVDFAEYVLPSIEEIKMVMNALKKESKTIKEVITFSPEEKHPHLLRTIGWFLKMGVIKLIN